MLSDSHWSSDVLNGLNNRRKITCSFCMAVPIPRGLLDIRRGHLKVATLRRFSSPQGVFVAIASASVHEKDDTTVHHAVPILPESRLHPRNKRPGQTWWTALIVPTAASSDAKTWEYTVVVGRRTKYILIDLHYRLDDESNVSYVSPNWLL